MSKPESKAIISGIGQSAVGRRLNVDELELTIDACLAAIADAGLTPADIDGIASYPGGMIGGGDGFAGPGTPTVQDALRLQVNWHQAGPEGPAQLGAIVAAMGAVANGLAKHVLVYRTVTEATVQGSKRRAAIGAGASEAVGMLQWMLPFRAFSSATWFGLYATRYMHEYGMTREQLGQIAVNSRRNAQLNPKAIYRDPMTIEDYLNARMVCSPFGLYDCDTPCDGSTAVIVSLAEHAPNVDHPIARFEAVGTALHGRPSWDQWDDITTMAARDAAAHMWSRTDLKPSDVDIAELYDGFTWLTVAWLEALNLVPKGEAGPFLEGGQRIALDGELPLNTHGGQLSGGRLHGFGFVHEAVLQLRGEAGDRQVKSPEIAVVTNGGGPLAGAMLLTKG